MEENTDRLAIHIMVACTLLLLLTAKWFLIPKIYKFMGKPCETTKIIFVEKGKNE